MPSALNPQGELLYYQDTLKEELKQKINKSAKWLKDVWEVPYILDIDQLEKHNYEVVLLTINS